MGIWRDEAAPIIAEVLQRVGTGDMNALRKALREAYPFGDRKCFPYKVWCSEIKRQLGRPLVGRKQQPGGKQSDLFS
jgi:hypothetical protein